MTDRLRSYGVAHRELDGGAQPGAIHSTHSMRITEQSNLMRRALAGNQGAKAGYALVRHLGVQICAAGAEIAGCTCSGW